MDKVTTLDFETHAISKRPDYPPQPVGLAYRGSSDRKSNYFAFAHDDHERLKTNNAETKEVEKLYNSTPKDTALLFHNAKFDLEVAQKHFNAPIPSWERVHDTMFMLYLLDPHAKSFGLKPAAEKYLNEPPGEKDLLVEWVQKNVWRETKDNDTRVKVTPKKPKGYLKVPPTKAMAYIRYAPLKLTEKYAKGDTDRTYKLYKTLMPEIKKQGLEEAYNRERRLLPILLRNEQEGIRVDTKRLDKDAHSYLDAMATCERYIKKVLAKKDINIDSDQELADALDEKNLVTQWTYTEKSGQKSVSKDNLKIEHFRDRNLALALAYRSRLSTCLSTFIRPWLEMADNNNDHIHTSWNQIRQIGSGSGGVGAVTGRLSSRPNFMNIPTSFEDKGDGYEHPDFLKVPRLPMLRDYLLADKGCVLIDCDYSQQELRILAHYAGGRLLKEFQKNPKTDVHTLVQELILRATGVTFQRKFIKTINFGIIYGMGLQSTADKLGLSLEDTQALQNAHKKALPEVYDFIFEVKRQAKMGNPTKTWGGRIYYPEPPKVIKGRLRSFEYKLVNYKIQGSAGDCTKESIIRYEESKKHGRFWVTVHDQNVISVPREHATKEKKILIDAMQSVEFDLPMLVDCARGYRWGDCK